jgi:hypothetical protein
MAGTAEKTDPKLWDRVKKEVTDSEKGGRKGQWSARKAQLASAEYKKKGGGYKGAKTADNHLVQWTEEDWGTKSGRASKSTGERYLPRKAREKLSDGEYNRTTAKKRKDTAKGKQFSSQPADVAKKTAGARKTGTAAAKRRPAAEPAPARKAAAAPRTAPARRAASAKPAARKAATGKAPARKTAAARKAAPAKAAARKPATTARGAAAKGAARKAAPSGAARKPAARKPAARKPAAKRTPAAARRAPRAAAATRSAKGGSKR